MKRYRITQYTDRIGNEKWKVEYRFLCFWIRIQRPYELADGMTDPFSREEALWLIEKHSGKRIKVLGSEEINI